MPIRWKNMDKNGEGIGSLAQPHHYVYLGDTVTNTFTNFAIFVAPERCTIDRVNLYTHSSATAVSGNSNALRMELFQGASSTTTLQSQVTITACNNTYDIDANSAFAISPSGHNSFSRGTILTLQICATSGTKLSAVTAEVIWTPSRLRSDQWSAVGITNATS